MRGRHQSYGERYDSTPAPQSPKAPRKIRSKSKGFSEMLTLPHATRVRKIENWWKCRVCRYILGKKQHRIFDQKWRGFCTMPRRRLLSAWIHGTPRRQLLRLDICWTNSMYQKPAVQLINCVVHYFPPGCLALRCLLCGLEHSFFFI